jgi:hypothetical protein
VRLWWAWRALQWRWSTSDDGDMRPAAEVLSARAGCPPSRLLGWPLANDNNARRIFNETSATLAAVGGVPGFFEPRVPPPVFMPQGTPEDNAHGLPFVRRREGRRVASSRSAPEAELGL